MIKSLVKHFDLIERDVNLLTRALIFLLLIIVFRATYLGYSRDFANIWPLLGPFTAAAAAILVSRIASRLIVHGQVLREDDRRREVVRVTHQLLAVAKDLKARTGYFNKLMAEGNKPVAVILSLATSIENRYEALFDKDAYQFLPGESIDLINNLSGSIFGMLVAAEILGRRGADNSLRPIKDLTGQLSEDFNLKGDQLLEEIQTLINQVYKLRASLDVSVQEKH